MEISDLDSKIKKLIVICQKTQNYKKLAKVGFVLLKNRIYEIGINLGVRPMMRDKNTRIMAYMVAINKIFRDNLKIPIFSEETINKVKIIEFQYLKRNRNLPKGYIKEIFKLYYDLRMMETPNLYEDIDPEALYYPNSLSNQFFLSGVQSEKHSTSDVVKSLMLQKVNSQEIIIRNKLKESFDKDLIEQAISLKQFKNSLDHSNGNKIKVSGSLKDNLDYHYFKKSNVGLFFLGTIILLLCIGIILLIETMHFPLLTGHLNFLISIAFGTSGFLILLYWNYFHKGRS